MNEEAKDLIDRISQISDNTKKNLKPLILKLAYNIADNINHPEIVNLAKAEGIEDVEKKDVGTIMRRLRNKYEWSFSLDTIYRYLPNDLKRKRVDNISQPIRINENSIRKLDPERFQEMKEILKKIDKENTPAKDIISKARIDDMEKYTWNCHLAEELAMIAIKMEKEHNDKHEDKLCKKYAKRVKMVRDSRFATDANSYEAIILACNTTQSLKNSLEGEWEFKTVWEIRDDEDKCRECIQEKCRAEGCKHECHRVVRPMTTKGLKYAIKTNEDLKELDSHIKRLKQMDNDICRIGKILLENPKTQKKLGMVEIKKLIYSHVDKDECLQCDMFLEKNPTFFDQEN